MGQEASSGCALLITTFLDIHFFYPLLLRVTRVQTILEYSSTCGSPNSGYSFNRNEWLRPRHTSQRDGPCPSRRFATWRSARRDSCSDTHRDRRDGVIFDPSRPQCKYDNYLQPSSLWIFLINHNLLLYCGAARTVLSLPTHLNWRLWVRPSVACSRRLSCRGLSGTFQYIAVIKRRSNVL